MSQLTEIIIKSGVVPPNVLAEVRRWGLPTGDASPPSELDAPVPIEKLCEAIDEAIQNEGFVLLRETDLELIPQYLNTMQRGVLHLTLENDNVQKFEVYFGRNHVGEYLMPWRSDTIIDLMTNGETYLKVDREKIFFSSARELFFGDNKAFLVCTASTKEPDAHRE